MSYGDDYADLDLPIREPSGRPAWPFVLVEGEEKAGKSYALAELTADPRIGRSFLFDFEGRLDEYASLGNYALVDWNGTFSDFLAKLRAVAAAPRLDPDRPNLIGIDPATALWRLQVDRANERAHQSKANRERLARDPDAEVTISMNLWNDAKARWRQVMDVLMTFDGIAVVTARGGEVAALDGAGNPTGEKTWSVQAEKSLPSDVTAWVRVHREPRRSELVGLVSLTADASKVDALPSDGTLAHVIFDLAGAGSDTPFEARRATGPVLGISVGTAKTRLLNAVKATAEGLSDDEALAEARRLWEISGLADAGEEIPPADLADVLATVGQEEPPEEPQEPEGGQEPPEEPEGPQDAPEAEEAPEEAAQEEPEVTDVEAPALEAPPSDFDSMGFEDLARIIEAPDGVKTSAAMDSLKKPRLQALSRAAGQGDHGTMAEIRARLTAWVANERRAGEETAAEMAALDAQAAEGHQYAPGEEPF